MLWTFIVAAIACGAVLGAVGFLWHRLRRLQDRLDELSLGSGSPSQDVADLERRLRSIERLLREQVAVEVVLGNLLVEKGVVDEDELEATHQRLVIEPALLDGEHESLLAELPETEQLRARLIRNLPLTLQ
ncbi:MAG: hypothetical protein ABIJ09_01200 [Pseudomonadota bacterium]